MKEPFQKVYDLVPVLTEILEVSFDRITNGRLK